MDLVVRVRAAGDSSLTAVFRPLLAASAQAQRQVEAAASRSGKATQSIYRESGRAAVAAADMAAQAAEKSASKEQKAHERALKHVAAIRERYFREEQARQEKAVKDSERAQAKMASQASAAARTFGGLARTGVGAVGRAASEAFGVDVDVFAAAGRARETQDIAGRATRSAATAKGQIATAADVEATVKAIQDGGDRAKLGYGKMAEGLEDFVSKSSDLKTGTAVLARMGVIAQATGADVKDLLSAGGDVNRELDDSPDRAERLLSIMRLVAKQGAMGNVEVKDLARYMARVEATAFMYEGSKDRNIGILGALAQVSMKGGASSAAEATRSAAAFARDLTKSKSIEAFSKEGIDVFSDKTKTKLKSPEEIIAKVLEKTNGDLSKLSNLFRNDASRKVMLGFASIYEQAGGGQKGIEATRGEFKRYSTTMSQEEMNAQARTALESDTAAAQTFKNELEKIGQQMGHEIAPALREFTPVAKGAAEALAGVVRFGAEHPGLAITGAIVASIGKAALGESIGKAVGGLLSNLTPANAGLGVLAGAAIAAALAIMSYVEKSDKEKDKGDMDPRLLEKANKELKETGTISRETIDKIAMRRAEVAGMQSALKTGGVETQDLTAVAIAELGYDKAGTIATGEGATRDAKEKGKEGVDALAGKLDALIAAYKESEKKPKGPIDVNIIGGMPSPAPAVNNAARSGDVN